MKSKKVKITIIVISSILLTMLVMYGLISALNFVNTKIENPYNTIEDICKEKLNYDQEKDKLTIEVNLTIYDEFTDELIEIYDVTIYEPLEFGPNLYFNYKIEIQYEFNGFLKNIGIKNIKKLSSYTIYREAK